MNSTLEKSWKLQQTTIIYPEQERRWFFFDLKDQIIGRAAVLVAKILKGKEKEFFYNNFDLGNFVVVVNAKHAKVTGKNKLINQYYYSHSGYIGNLKKRNMKLMKSEYSEELFFRIIRGMMAKNNLSKKQLKRMFVFPEEKHHLQAQEKNFINLFLDPQKTR